MLSGGTEQIVGVMGGGTRRNKNRRQRKSSKKTSKMSRRRRKSSLKSGGANANANANANEKNPFILTLTGSVESAEVPAATFNYKTLKQLGVTGIPLITLPNEPVSVLIKSVNEYIKAQRKMWKYHSINGADLAITPSVISTEICSSIKYPSIDGRNGVSGYDRLSIILPKETQHIIVFPPCYGNLITYGKCAEYINNSTDSNTVFIFTPPFYSREQSESKENRTIFHSFISMKKALEEDGLASAHILSEYTNATVSSACILTTGTIHKETSLLPMLEPTYIIYPYMIKIDGDSVNGIIFSAAAHDEVILPESNIASKSGLIVTSQNGISGGHTFPPNTNKNDALLKESSIPYRQYRFFSKDSEDILNTSGERVTMIKLGGSTVSEPQSGGKQDEDQENKKFEASNSVSLEGVSYTSVPLGAHQYSLRHPTTNIIDDWKNEIFTEDEAKFLNELNLRPYILEDIYKNNDKTWQGELANNMATIVRSKCFNDSRLVLHSDCQASQKFITDILEYFVKHEKRISSLEDDEDEARNREVHLKYEKAKAKLEASDLDVDTTGWDKDPIADGLVRATGQKVSDPNMDYNIVTNIVSNEYTMVRSLINKKTGEETIGEIVCTSDEANNEYENAKKILMDKYGRIDKEYPGWFITP
jgi:hypothetical protein